MGRDSISIRLIAVGALVVLLVRPETIAGPSFQFSFAAVTAIVAMHSTQWARRTFQRRDDGIPLRFGRAVFALLVTGLAVEIALMPFALDHFHKAGMYSVAANLVAIPLTTFVIMPLEAGALLLDLVGIGAPLWILAGAAVDALLWVAHTVATTPGAVATLPSMPRWAFAAMVAGGLWLCLWTTRVRTLGLIPFAIGAAAAAVSPVPDVLVTGDGRHLAIVSDNGRPMILRDRSGSYIRDLLSEASGFDDEPGFLAEANFGDCSRDSCVAFVERSGRLWKILATRSQTRIDWRTLVYACAQVDIVVSDRWLPRSCTPRWLKLDRKTLERTGGVAIYLDEQPSVKTVSERLGEHPWAHAVQSGAASQTASSFPLGSVK